MVFEDPDPVRDELRHVLPAVEELVNDRDLRQAKSVFIGELLQGTAYERALNRVLEVLRAWPVAVNNSLASRARKAEERPRTVGQLLINPLGELAKRAYEHRAPLKTFEGQKYIERLYASSITNSLAVVERRERLRGGRVGELLDAYVVVVPGGAFRRAGVARNRWAPTPAFQAWIDRSLPPLERPSLPKGQVIRDRPEDFDVQSLIDHDIKRIREEAEARPRIPPFPEEGGPGTGPPSHPNEPLSLGPLPTRPPTARERWEYLGDPEGRSPGRLVSSTSAELGDFLDEDEPEDATYTAEDARRWRSSGQYPSP